MKPKKPAATDSRHRKGRALLKRIHGQRGIDAIDGMAAVAPDLTGYVYGFAYGEVYANPALDAKARQLSIVSALAALGTAGPQLKAHLRAALRVGWTRAELVEALTQLCVYAGFPASLNALKIAAEVFAESVDAPMPVEKKRPVRSRRT
jgi:4-carboxymuconolactone decarboxylase